MTTKLSAAKSTVSVIFGGDVMLGRNVKKCILQDGPAYPLGAIADLLRGADLCIVNLECAITNASALWAGAPKAFYFAAPPQAAQSLSEAGIDLVSLANNHILDLDTRGLADTLAALDARGIRHAGAGPDLGAALTPALAERAGLRFGMMAWCDHQADFAAAAAQPGMAHLDLRDEPAALVTLRHALESMQAAAVDWPILSLHWGPNMVLRPAMKFRRIAHAAIEMGWKIVFGHSAHVFQGIEIYHGCPIMYAAGDLVDDFYVDSDFRNDHQLLIELELEHSKLKGIVLHPVFIQHCRTLPANQTQASHIASLMTALCAELGTRLQYDGGQLRVHLDAH